MTNYADPKIDVQIPYQTEKDCYKIVIEKEYRKIPEKNSIGVLMMVKNESLRISVSLESIRTVANALIIYDTGSTDNTMEIIQNFAEKNSINLYMIQGTFVNFCVSRNVSLDYADKIPVQYLLLLDCNDELQSASDNDKGNDTGSQELKKFCAYWSDKSSNAFLIWQRWWSHTLDEYLNIRLVKARSGWRYFGVVHEYMKDTTIANNADGCSSKFPIPKSPQTFVLYQDRTKDDDKSLKRFNRDKILLLEEHRKFPHEPRTLFYLAQTCSCLSQFEDALFYSKLRLQEKGFDEEIFLSFIRAGECCTRLGHDWNDVMVWYLRGIENRERVEPYIKIAEHYIEKASKQDQQSRDAKQCWRLAYMFLREACELKYPEHDILFVNKGMYEYLRWHFMGATAMHVGKIEEGIDACNKAINSTFGVQEYKDMDRKNLEQYAKADKIKFIQENFDKLRKEMPDVPNEKLIARVEVMWDKSKKIEKKKGKKK